MQNKPNLLSAEMNINSALTKDYENIPPIRKCQNKPNQTQFQPKNEANKPNQTQFQPKNEADKPNQTQFYPPPADSKAKKMLQLIGPALTGDIDGNNVVNFDDLTEVVRYWLDNCQP